MHGRSVRFFAVIAIIAGSASSVPWSHALKITLPRRSALTPVQRLNREGVEATRKHEYEKAEALFYKAYLFDPSDPFTLNNLGYTAELQGQLDRAQKFYAMASKQGCDAVIALSSMKELQGKPMVAALGDLKDVPMTVNRMNVQATQLLSQDRGFEAEALLQHTLQLDPNNPFTLNNMGVAEEAVGNFELAMKYYRQAADTRSSEPVTVTLKRQWRGKPVSEMAADSARELQRRMRHMDLDKARAAMLAMRGVAESNENDWQAARRDFIEAYRLDPNSAFALNNLGYVSEKDGDLETAQFFYARARRANDANARVGLATAPVAQGENIAAVAVKSDQDVGGALSEYAQTRRGEGDAGTIQLLQRDGTPVPLPPSPQAAPAQQTPPAQQTAPQTPNNTSSPQQPQ